MNREYLNELSFGIIGCAMRVHNEFGPGLLESVYMECMIYELINRGYKFKIQELVPLKYDNICLKSRMRLDILVEDNNILELKAVEAIHPIHVAQLLTYMKLSKKAKGLLINFNTNRLKDSIRSLVNEYYAELP